MIKPKELMKTFRDPNYDIAENGFHMIDELRHYLKRHPKERLKMTPCVHQYLLRLRKEYPCVYAITIGHFPEFEEIIERGIDPFGYMVLLPTPHGPYSDFIVERRYRGEGI